jgi:hypothetical protein
MRFRRGSSITILSLLLLAGAALAQEGGASRPAARRPHPPLETALDANGDGVIDAAEIANASAALKKLDKNRDGKLSPDEYRPPRPPDGMGPGGQKGPGGGTGDQGAGRPGRPPG